MTFCRCRAPMEGSAAAAPAAADVSGRRLVVPEPDAEVVKEMCMDLIDDMKRGLPLTRWEDLRAKKRRVNTGLAGREQGCLRKRSSRSVPLQRPERPRLYLPLGGPCGPVGLPE